MAESPTYYNGKRPLKLSKSTIERVLELCLNEGVYDEVAAKLDSAVNAFQKPSGGSLGSFRTLQNSIAEEHLVAVSPEAINSIKKALFDVGAHNRNDLAASILSVRTCNCPPPDRCKCPEVV